MIKNNNNKKTLVGKHRVKYYFTAVVHNFMSTSFTSTVCHSPWRHSGPSSWSVTSLHPYICRTRVFPDTGRPHPAADCRGIAAVETWSLTPAGRSWNSPPIPPLTLSTFPGTSLLVTSREKCEFQLQKKKKCYLVYFGSVSCCNLCPLPQNKFKKKKIETTK